MNGSFITTNMNRKKLISKNKILINSQLIKKEAEELLAEHNIIEILSKYGTVKFTGSYELDLMYKKDIDISLINDNLSVSDFTALGKELIDKLNTPSVYYRNTRITPVSKRPENALYWGIKTEEWFIDIWAMNKFTYLKAEKYIKEIKSKLNNHNRIIILQLKDELLKSQKYGKDFGSRELYDAVLNYNVTNTTEFKNYLTENKDNNNYI